MSGHIPRDFYPRAETGQGNPVIKAGFAAACRVALAGEFVERLLPTG